jgi:two-component system, NarL family, sensor histidine kinase UhpB
MSILRGDRHSTSMMSNPDQLKLPAVRDADGEAPSDPRPRGRVERPNTSRRAVPMVWRVFAANAAVFALAFALLALAPVTLHASIRLEELVLLLVGLVVMLVVDLLLIRQALEPLARLANVMRSVDLLHPGRRADAFDRSSTEVLALADAFNEMLQRLEDERRDSSARVLAAQEDERLRIARELHDEIGQTLTAVALRAEHAAGQGGPERRDLAELAAVVQQSLHDVRRITRELRPEALDELGLVNALIALCARVSEQSGLRIQRRLQGGLPELSPEMELAIYRVAQEALTNAMRHSKATEATVSLCRTNGELVLTVGDNGQGLPEHVSEGGGLTGMRERAMLIGAALTINSALGAGVEVTLRLGLDGKT